MGSSYFLAGDFRFFLEDGSWLTLPGSATRRKAIRPGFSVGYLMFRSDQGHCFSKAMTRIRNQTMIYPDNISFLLTFI